jgi:hypothetical protein
MPATSRLLSSSRAGQGRGVERASVTMGAGVARAAAGGDRAVEVALVASLAERAAWGTSPVTSAGMAAYEVACAGAPDALVAVADD